ncbi:MAG: hypothetical protein ACFCVC_15425 [Acidimicrobiia bacterium]
MRASRTFLILVVGSFLLSGCGLRTWVDVTIDDDSSGTVTLEVASDQELRDGLATFSPDVDAVAELTNGLADQGWVIETAPADGEWEGVVATQTFADFAELEGLLGEALQGGGSNLELVETDDGYSLAAALGPPASGTNEADLFAQVSDVIELDGRLSVRFPGKVTESNGTVSDDGQTVTWAYDSESIAGLEVTAEAAKPGQNPIVAVVVLAMGAGIGLALIRFIQRRRQASP